MNGGPLSNRAEAVFLRRGPVHLVMVEISESEIAAPASSERSVHSIYTVIIKRQQ